MSDPTYRLIATLPEETGKPYVRRLWLCEATRLYVKTHTTEKKAKFGKLSWSISGSLCDEHGKAIRDDGGEPLVHGDGHRFRALAERIEEEPDVGAITARMHDDFDAAHKLVVARVERAALALASARATL